MPYQKLDDAIVLSEIAGDVLMDTSVKVPPESQCQRAEPDLARRVAPELLWKVLRVTVIVDLGGPLGKSQMATREQIEEPRARWLAWEEGHLLNTPFETAVTYFAGD